VGQGLALPGKSPIICDRIGRGRGDGHDVALVVQAAGGLVGLADTTEASEGPVMVNI
jgi:hypothetical protein